MRLESKVAIVVGAGQTPGDTIGNGRATALLFAREGAKVVVVDRDEESADGTRKTIESKGGTAIVALADVTKEADCEAFVRKAHQTYGRIDVLHNNVGTGAGDSGPTKVDEEAWDRIYAINVKSVVFACKHALPIMREQNVGSIINVSSIASISATGLTAYKSSKAAVNAITHTLATGNARYGIRANAILPGFIDTPMAIEGISLRRGIDKDTLRKERDARVPMGKMGTAWDVAYAALFFASDESRFVTGAMLPVDGGQSAQIG